MAEKAKVSKDVVEAFEYIRKVRYYLNDSELLVEHVDAIQTNDWFSEAEPLNNVDALTFAQMLLNGYESVVSSTDE